MRNTKQNSEMLIPPCPTPRPGDNVTWYLDSRRVNGKYLGHNSKCQPVVETEFGTAISLLSFDQLRLSDPYHPRLANWNYLEDTGLIQKPTEDERKKFDKLLTKLIPPGLTYRDLIEEIWNRGYEVFLVGGTVRDVIAGKSSHDIDLVTSIPLLKSEILLSSMFRQKADIDFNNGFVRLGGAPKSGDPFIDLKEFTHLYPGTEHARFGSCFADDIHFRDFACNSIYYDPIDSALIDPTGTGISDAEKNILSLVCDTSKKNKYDIATIYIRFYKFLSRGFTASDETKQIVNEQFQPCLDAMKKSLLVRYTKTQIVSKAIPTEKPVEWQKFKEAMVNSGENETWDKYFCSLEEEILR
jgi:hypothetical protein